MSTYSTWYLVCASFIGFALYMTFAWQEWQKLTATKMSMAKFITDDQPGFISAVLLSVASFIVLPEIGQIAWVREYLGFTPHKTPMSALAASFVFSVLGYQARAVFLDKLFSSLGHKPGGA
jgi:hypothetical protein